MRNFISEDDIEQAILQKLEGDPFQYGILRCDPSPDKRELLPDGTGRSSKKECVLPLILREALARLNPGIPGEKLEEIARDLCRDFSATDMTATNYKYYNQIRNGIKISLRRNGKEDFDFVKLVDFDCPENNTFTAVSQMWIQGRVYWRRPDVLIFINGLPMVFVELKNSIVKVEEAYNDNLKNYLRDIPNLFAFNQICVLSNGLETRLGAFNATYNHFFEWLKVDSEKERPDRQALKEAGTVGESSVRYFIDGLLRKDRLIDYIEHFINVPQPEEQDHRQKSSVFRCEQSDGISKEPGGAAGQAWRILAHSGLRQVLFHGVLRPQGSAQDPGQFYVPDHHRPRRSGRSDPQEFRKDGSDRAERGMPAEERQTAAGLSADKQVLRFHPDPQVPL